MPRTATKKRRYTPEQVAAAKERDTQLREQGEAALVAPEFSARLVDLAESGVSLRILGYSVRNQALLMEQAAERGMPLRDVDTYKGWRERGRAVRKGETGLKIVRPVGRDTGDTEPTETSGTDSADQETNEDGPARFRLMTVFELSQTDGAEDVLRAIADEDPLTEVVRSLIAQLERADYVVTVLVDADREYHEMAPVEVNHEGRQVTIAGECPPRDVIAELCPVVAHVATQRGTRRRDRVIARAEDSAPVLAIA